MERLIGWTKADAWGSTNAIPEFLGAAAGDDPVSEVWFGAHPDGPTLSVRLSGIYHSGPVWAIMEGLSAFMKALEFELGRPW